VLLSVVPFFGGALSDKRNYGASGGRPQVRALLAQQRERVDD
jgi:hypothetical protein